METVSLPPALVAFLPSALTLAVGELLDNRYDVFVELNPTCAVPNLLGRNVEKIGEVVLGKPSLMVQAVQDGVRLASLSSSKE